MVISKDIASIRKYMQVSTNQLVTNMQITAITNKKMKAMKKIFYIFRKKITKNVCSFKKRSYICNDNNTITNNKKMKAMKRKYELTGETLKLYGTTFRRIKALIDFSDVMAGDLGGWVENEDNLSHDGDAWVYGNARVYNDARVFGNALVFDNARVYGNAEIHGEAWVFGNAKVFDNAQVYKDAWVYGDAQVYDNARVYGNALVYGDAQVFGNVGIR